MLASHSLSERGKKIISARLYILFLEKGVEAAIIPFLLVGLTQQIGAYRAGVSAFVISLFAILSSLLSGIFSDYFGRRDVLILSEMLRLFALAGLFYTSLIGTNIDLIVIGLILISISSSLSAPACEALIMDASNDGHEIRYIYSLMYTVSNFSRGTGTIIGGLFFNTHFTFILLFSLVASVVCLLIILSNVKNTNKPTSHIHINKLIRNGLTSYITALKDRSLRLYLVASMFGFGISIQLPYYIAARLERDIDPFHFALFDTSILLSGVSIFAFLRFETNILVILLMGFVQKKIKGIKPEILFVVGSSLFTLGHLVLCISSDFSVLIFFTAVFTLGELLCGPAQISLLAAISPTKFRARYSALSSIVNSRVVMLIGSLGLMGASSSVNIYILPIVLISFGAGMLFFYLKLLNRVKASNPSFF